MTDRMPPGSAVVFVGGCDRSGTTIVSRLIAERAGLLVLPEAHFHAVAFRRWGAAATAGDAVRHWRRQSWQLARVPSDPEEPLARFLLGAMSGFHRRARGCSEPLRVIESTPLNIEIASILLAEFSGSMVVHVIRDPRAVTASLLAVDFGPRTAQQCARLWKERMASGLAAAAAHPGRVVTIRYEDVLTKVGALDEVVARLEPDPGYGWDARRDLFIDATSASVQRRVTGRPDPRRCEAWRETLTAGQIAAVEHECRQLMMALGYRLDGYVDGRSSLHRRLDALRSSVGELVIDTPRRTWRVLRALAPASARSRPVP